jgi:hypothetical protein
MFLLFYVLALVLVELNVRLTLLINNQSNLKWNQKTQVSKTIERLIQFILKIEEIRDFIWFIQKK